MDDEEALCREKNSIDGFPHCWGLGDPHVQLRLHFHNAKIMKLQYTHTHTTQNRTKQKHRTYQKTQQKIVLRFFLFFLFYFKVQKYEKKKRNKCNK